MALNIAIHEVVALFTHHRNYALVIDNEEISLCADDISIMRSRDYIEFTFSDKSRITIPSTISSLEHFRLVRYHVNRSNSAIFTPYKVVKAQLLNYPDNEISNIEVVVQHLPDYQPLEEYIGNHDIHCDSLLDDALSHLESSLHECRAYLRHIDLGDLVIAPNSNLYPTRYRHLYFDRDADSYNACDKLRQSLKLSATTPTPHNFEPYGLALADPLKGFLWCGNPHEDRIAIELESGYGFANSAGDIVIPPTYLAVDSFREGRAVVKTNEGYGVINLWGKAILPTIYQDIEYDENTGITRAKLNNLWAKFSYRGDQLLTSSLHTPELLIK